MDKLRLVQCGTGSFGKIWLRKAIARSPDFELVALVDPDAERLARAAKVVRLPGQRCFDTLEAALDGLAAAGITPEAVLTVTPPAVHVEHARLAFERGLHLLTEKPIADSFESAQAMVRLAAESDRQLVVSQNYRYRPFIQTIRRLLAEERYGPLGHGHIDFYLPIDFSGGFRDTIRYPLLFDMSIHHVDLIRWVTGHDIVRVTAHTFNPAWSWIHHDAALKMLLELEGNLPFSYSGDWTAYGKATTWNGSWRLQCAGASIHLDKDRITVGHNQRWNKNPLVERVQPDQLPEMDTAAILTRFAEAIRSGQPAETSGADNLRSFAVVEAGRISTEQRRTVEINELLDA
jgi:predicted dehydrogenase